MDIRISRGVGFTWDWYVNRLRMGYGLWVSGEKKKFSEHISYTVREMGFTQITRSNQRYIVRNIEPRFTNKVSNAPHCVMNDLLDIETMYLWARGGYDLDVETARVHLLPVGGGLLCPRTVITGVNFCSFAVVKAKDGEGFKQWQLL